MRELTEGAPGRRNGGKILEDHAALAIHHYGAGPLHLAPERDDELIGDAKLIGLGNRATDQDFGRARAVEELIAELEERLASTAAVVLFELRELGNKGEQVLVREAAFAVTRNDDELFFGQASK